MNCIKKKEEPHGLDICKGVKMSNKDDLLNMGNGNNPNNMKKILIYVAIAFLIFVIGVIGFAIIQNSNNSEKNTIIPPETQTQPKQDNLFKQIPIESKNTKTPQTQHPAKNIKAEVLQSSTTNKEENKSDNNIKNVIQNKPNVINNKPEVKQKVNVQKNNIKEKPVTIPSVKKIKTYKKVINPSKYYIQVAALLRYKKASKKFLHLIVKSGYKYRFFVTYIKLKNKKVKVTKILVGPFLNEKAANKALRKVKANINQNAFIFKVK